MAYLFARKGVVIVRGGRDRDDVLAAVLDSGAGGQRPRRVVRVVARHRPDRCAGGLQEAGIEYDSAEAAFLPSVSAAGRGAGKRVFRLIEAIEDSDDVQDVYANLGADEIVEKLG